MTLFRQLPLRIILFAMALCLWPGFLSQAPNRLQPGHPVPLFAATGTPILAGMACLCAALVAGAILPPARTTRWMVLAASLALIPLTLAGAGEAAHAMAAHATPAARSMLGAGFWCLIFLASLAAADALQGLGAEAGARFGAPILPVAACAVLAWSGALNDLSLAREFATHRAAFWAAVAQHLMLVATTLVIACGIGFPLGLAIQRRPAWRPSVFAVLNVVQTVPSVALFGLLITPLAAAGLSGIGAVPALIALVLYALLPVVRNTVAGLDGVDLSVREAARGIGLSPRQILTKIELPLAAPTLLAGLRIVAVQAIGLAVVAALIGAGGLGDFVFQGLGQYAIDLVLLGALPAIFLALVADGITQAIAERVRMQLA